MLTQRNSVTTYQNQSWFEWEMRIQNEWLTNVIYLIFGSEYEFVSWILCQLLVYISFIHDTLDPIDLIIFARMMKEVINWTNLPPTGIIGNALVLLVDLDFTESPHLWKKDPDTPRSCNKSNHFSEKVGTSSDRQTATNYKQ